MTTATLEPPPAQSPTYTSWPLYSLLFLLLANSVLPAELLSALNGYFLLLALFVWISKRRALPNSLGIVYLGFVSMLAVGMVTGLSNELYPYFKDAWYFVNPVIVITVGYCFGAQTPMLREALRILLIAGVLLGIYHLSKFALNPSLFSLPATEVRSIAGNGNFVVGLTFALLLGRFGKWRESFSIHPAVGLLMLGVCAASVALAYSRTLVLVAFVFWIALRGYMVGSRFVKVIAIAAVLLAVLGTVASMMPKATEMEKKTFTGKLLRSAQELTVSDYQDEQSINDNFRGFETARALKAYADGGLTSWLGGRGLGHFVDLGVFLNLGEGPMRYIPIFHNGIIYVLVKTGALGLSFYLLTFAWLFKRGSTASQSSDRAAQAAGRVVQGCVAVLIFTSWLISGPFNKSALFSVLLLLGFSLAIIERKEWLK